MRTDPRTRAIAGIAPAVAAGATAVPAPFLRVFGIAPDQVTGSAASGVIIALDVARRRDARRPYRRST